MGLGLRLKSLRDRSGESLQQVADAVGVSKAHVWELEKGRSANPSFDLVRRLARHYAVSPEVLLGDAAVPGDEDLQLERLHRDIGELSPRDRDVIEDMVRALKARGGADGGGSAGA
ncbi:MAG: helix-turn-helix transcriptional regulator [Pseudomonadota bacterium]